MLPLPSRRTVATTMALITAVPLALTGGGSVASGGTTRSLAMYNAARLADRWHGSPVAAAAVAAHDVLAEYFPTSAVALRADLTASLGAIPEGWAKQAGMRTGDGVATRLIKSRKNDGRNDPSIVYTKAAAPGVWQPAPGATMVAPWIGFVDLLVLHRPLRANGPDPINSFDYAMDYQEVMTVGALAGADRTNHQTDTALFFNSNSAIGRR